jgi:hypothetical protein
VSSQLPHSSDFFSLSARLDYECNEGYILANGATSKSVTCKETNGTYYWQEDVGACIGTHDIISILIQYLHHAISLLSAWNRYWKENYSFQYVIQIW